jgi:hypothetical protein
MARKLRVKSRSRKVSKRSRRSHKGKKTQKRKIIKRQTGGAIPTAYYPEGGVVTVRDADDYESPFYTISREDAEEGLIAASDRSVDDLPEESEEGAVPNKSSNISSKKNVGV